MLPSFDPYSTSHCRHDFAEWLTGNLCYFGHEHDSEDRDLVIEHRVQILVAAAGVLEITRSRSSTPIVEYYNHDTILFLAAVAKQDEESLFNFLDAFFSSIKYE